MPKAPKLYGSKMLEGSKVQFVDAKRGATYTVKVLRGDAVLVEDQDGQLALVHPSWLKLIEPWRDE
jgi:hypothetical protein